MPIQNSPYDAFTKLLSSSGHPCSPAELHGVLLGRSCTGVGFDADNWLADVAELLEKEPEDNVRNALIGLQEMVKGELTGDDVTVVLLLILVQLLRSVVAPLYLVLSVVLSYSWT